MKERILVKGHYTIESENVLTGEKKIVHKDNIVTNLFYAKLFEFLSYPTDTPTNAELGANYIAVGDNTATAAASNTTLGAEVFRGAVLSKTKGTTAFSCRALIDRDEGNPTGGSIKEIGVFANGTATVDSGTLLSRANVDIVKNTNIRLFVNWELSFTQA